jgi:hypothetical protein
MGPDKALSSKLILVRLVRLPSSGGMGPDNPLPLKSS